HNCNVVLNHKRKLLTTKSYGKNEAQRIEEYTVSLLKFVIGVQAPFTMVESPWFYEMMSTLDPHYVSPTRTYIKEQIMSQFQAQREKLNQLCNDMNINDKIISLMTDNHSTMILCGDLLEREWNEFGLLYPILQATELPSSSFYPTMSDVRLCFGGILQHLDKFINEKTHSEEECMIADSIQHKLSEYWVLLDESITITAILDPSSKLTTFAYGERRDKAIANQQIEEPLEELDLYLSSPLCSEDLLNWWALNGSVK
ncbi:11338_t:CDS:2, partial [Dentiscutata heterogama]